ncbi:MAG: hypothetical protein KJP02_08595 [Octadecabacter sp.]|nr:hypothetical protein [Octadecabacter sp.]
MNKILISSLIGCIALAGCDGENPFTVTEPTGAEEGIPEGVDGNEPTATNAIVRYEERNDNGGGYAEDFNYDADTDTFTVDNLAFDGEGPYTRGVAVSDLGPTNAYAVYDAEIVVPDFLNGEPIPQIRPYRAIVGVSPNTVGTEPRTSFAIVRTGGYRDYGFGGFVYERQGGVVMPNSGQAVFEGDYAGIRIFNGPDGTSGGLEFTEADIRIQVDFDDPTDGQGGVDGNIYNRIAFDINGDPVLLGNDGEAGELPLPPIAFVLNGEIGNINESGELNGDLISSYTDPDGNTSVYETGTYYGILAGDASDAADGGEIVGIIVIESEDPRFDGVTAQETGGFILIR